MPLVSVILPTYNRAAYLSEAVDSVLAQTHDDLEVLVIDDGSTDGTADLMLARYDDDERVRHHYQPNAGVSAARNTGIKLARGEMIAFIDSDDAWKPWKLKLQLRCLELAPEAGMLWTDMEAISADGAAIAPAYLAEYYRAYRYFTREMLFSRSLHLDNEVEGLPHEAAGRRLYVGDIFSQMIMGNLVHTSTAIVVRKRIVQAGGFDESLRKGGEDFGFWLRVCRAGPVAYADVSSIRYRIGLADSLSGVANDPALAESYLATITPVLARDRSRITLSPEMIAAALAHGHNWLGRALLLAGSPTRARPHLRRTLRLRPWQLDALILATLAHGPSAIAVPSARAMKAVHRAIRSRRRGSSIMRSSSQCKVVR